MARLFALLYYHFAKVLVDEHGKDRGEELIVKEVKNFALERGNRMREEASRLGLDLTPRTTREISDLPRYTFYTDENGTFCPFADEWEEKGDLGRKLGLLYCNMNDP